LHQSDAFHVLFRRVIHHRPHKGTANSPVLRLGVHRDWADTSDAGTQIDKIGTDDPMIIFRDKVIEAGGRHQHGHHSGSGLHRGKIAWKAMLIGKGLKRHESDSSTLSRIPLSGRTDNDGHWKLSRVFVSLHGDIPISVIRRKRAFVLVDSV
jgi:hypothetical protein